MNTNDDFTTVLPSDLQARLKMIIQTTPNFWEQRPHRHFTNHGPSHSERVQRKVAQLAQELPEANRLTNDEIFIVSAAAWLYETGMQSPNLKPVLDFDYQPGDTLSFSQLEEIREKRHLLTKNLIVDSVRSDYQGPPLQLGLIRPADAYTHLIAEICRWCSEEPLEDVSETLPVRNMSVRVRLLVALLRLADQLYIDSSRINLDLLQRADLPTRELAHWWTYHYAQVLPIVNGQIRFHYFLPVTQKEYLGHIRALVEPEFKFDHNPTIRYLWQEHQLRLMPDITPTFRFDQPAGFLNEMDRDLIVYLRDKVSPMDVPVQTTQKPEEEPQDRALLVLDYENFILQLGQQGHFFTPKEIGRLVVNLLREASNQYAGSVDALAVGHWGRPDLAETAEILQGRVYDLLPVKDQENSSTKIGQELTQLLQGPDAPQQIILVAPRGDLAPTIRKFTRGKQSVSAWISDLPDADVYRAIVRKYKSLANLLQLRDTSEIDASKLEDHQTSCILRLDDEIINKGVIPLDELPSVLEQVEEISERNNWWQLWLFNRKILLFDASSQQFLVRLNLQHPDVTKVYGMRGAVIKTLQTLSQNGGGVRQDYILKDLKHFTDLRDRETTLSFLKLLKEEDVVYFDARPSLPDNQPLWQLNTAHWSVIVLNPDSYLAQFVLAFDHALVRAGYPSMHEHTVTRNVGPSLGHSVAETVYKLACNKGWVNRQNSYDRRRSRDVVNVSLTINNHAQVGETMRNRDILLNTLYRKPAREGMERSALWQKLSNIRSFTLDRDELNHWISFLENDSIVTVNNNDQNAERDVIKLNTETPLTQRLLGRINIHGLLKTMRIMGATRFDGKKMSSEVEKRTARFVTRNDKLAHWTLEYAKGIRLVKDEQGFVFLNQHSFVRRLDRRERSVCSALTELVRALAQNRRDAWVRQQDIWREMEKDPQFGYGRGEHEYWLNQAIYRQRLLEERKERTGPRLQVFVRVK